MEKNMLDHVSIGVRDIDAAKRFYDAVLAPLGYSCLRVCFETRYGESYDGVFENRSGAYT